MLVAGVWLLTMVVVAMCCSYSAPRWQEVMSAVVKASGWKRAWVPEKLQALWHTLSARAHDVRIIQGQERDAVVISTKVLSGG